MTTQDVCRVCRSLVTPRFALTELEDGLRAWHKLRQVPGTHRRHIDDTSKTHRRDIEGHVEDTSNHRNFMEFLEFRVSQFLWCRISPMVLHILGDLNSHSRCSRCTDVAVLRLTFLWDILRGQARKSFLLSPLSCNVFNTSFLTQLGSKIRAGEGFQRRQSSTLNNNE